MRTKSPVRYGHSSRGGASSCPAGRTRSEFSMTFSFWFFNPTAKKGKKIPFPCQAITAATQKGASVSIRLCYLFFLPILEKISAAIPNTAMSAIIPIIQPWVIVIAASIFPSSSVVFFCLFEQFSDQIPHDGNPEYHRDTFQNNVSYHVCASFLTIRALLSQLLTI